MTTMMKSGLAAAGVAVVALSGAGITAVPAAAAGAASCVNHVGLVTAAGHHGGISATSTRPPTVHSGVDPERIFQPGTVLLASRADEDAIDEENTRISGLAVIGDALHSYNYTLDQDRRFNDGTPPQLTRIGGGWGQYRFFEISASMSWSRAYGVNKDGVLTRWIVSNGRFTSPVSVAGFGDVKAMALISQTSTYDTFLINRTSGVLQTVRVPVTSPQKPVIKTVRSRSWQGFESFVVHACGGGTVLTAIDRDTSTGYQYALSKANGTSTVIDSIGKIPATFDAPVYFRWAPLPGDDVLVGE